MRKQHPNSSCNIGGGGGGGSPGNGTGGSVIGHSLGGIRK